MTPLRLFQALREQGREGDLVYSNLHLVVTSSDTEKQPLLSESAIRVPQVKRESGTALQFRNFARWCVEVVTKSKIDHVPGKHETCF